MPLQSVLTAPLLLLLQCIVPIGVPPKALPLSFFQQQAVLTVRREVIFKFTPPRAFNSAEISSSIFRQYTSTAQLLSSPFCSYNLHSQSALTICTHNLLSQSSFLPRTSTQYPHILSPHIFTTHSHTTHSLSHAHTLNHRGQADARKHPRARKAPATGRAQKAISADGCREHSEAGGVEGRRGAELRLGRGQA